MSEANSMGSKILLEDRITADVSMEYKEFALQARGEGTAKKQILGTWDKNNIQLYRMDGNAYLVWGDKTDMVDSGWANGFLGKIAGISDVAAYDLLRAERINSRIKVIVEDVWSKSRKSYGK